MKLLIPKQSSVVFFLLMILILLSTSNTGYGQDKEQAETINPPLSERTPQIRDAIVAAVPGVNAAADVTAAHLAAISRLDASKKSITALKSGDFSGLTALTNLYLYENAISDISALKDLTSLTRLYLYDNAISDISPLKNLTSLTRLELYSNAISDISALENLTSLTNLWLFSNAISDISVLENLTSLTDLWLTGNAISNISALEDLTSLTDLFLESNSISDTSPLEGLTNLTRLHLKGNPISDYGPVRRLKAAIEAAGSDIYIDVDIGNKPPVFTDGPSTTRTVAENTPSGQNIGTPIAATDVDGDTLTCTLSGTDAASFSILAASGQLQTSAALDFETKNSYSVTVDVSDGNGGSDSIPVTINVTNVNEAPSFATTTASRSIAENTAANTNIGDPVTATDADSDTLTYSLDGTDASSFSIVSTSGQLRTNAALDYETKPSYSVSVSVSDGKGGNHAITVTIDVTDANDAPVFTDIARRRIVLVPENTASGTNIGALIAATDADSDTLTYSLSGADASSFSIVSTLGQLQAKVALDYETKSSYAFTVSVSDGNGGTDSINVTIRVTNVNEAPAFTDSSSTIRTIAENTAADTNIGSAVSATDPDTDDTLTYSLSGADAASFSINSTNGQLRTSAALDYETKTSYTVRITVSDSELTDTIDVTINVTNVDENRAPSFTDGNTTTRLVAENTASGQDIGTAVAATDADDDTLTYSLEGTDAASFRIDTSTGQLRTRAALDYETKTSYSVTVSVSDGNGSSDSIDVTINVTNVNEAPSFTDDSTTRAIAENTASNTNIGDPVTATDVDASDTLTYTLEGADAASFNIVSTTGQLKTKAALDFETTTSYSVRITVF